MKYTITKSTVECYKLRHESGMYWADITVDAKGKTGRIQIASDYGSWQYYWGACGQSFKEFLLKLDIGYAASKFGEGHWFDIERTIALNKELVIEYRKREEVNAETARKMFDELNELADHNTTGEFVMDWYNKETLPDVFQEHPDCSYSVSPQFKAFWKNCWPAFCEELRKELAAAIL